MHISNLHTLFKLFFLTHRVAHQQHSPAAVILCNSSKLRDTTRERTRSPLCQRLQGRHPPCKETLFSHFRPFTFYSNLVFMTHRVAHQLHSPAAVILYDPSKLRVHCLHLTLQAALQAERCDEKLWARRGERDTGVENYDAGQTWCPLFRKGIHFGAGRDWKP